MEENVWLLLAGTSVCVCCSPHVHYSHCTMASKWIYTGNHPINFKNKAHVTDFLFDCLQVKVGDPVNEIKQTKGSWKKYAGVGVHFVHTDMYSSVSPCACSAVLKAAEKTCTVLAIKTFITIFFVPFLEVSGIVHLNSGWSWTDINRRSLGQMSGKKGKKRGKN